MYDINTIKEKLTIDQVFDLVHELGGEPKMQQGFFVSQTICHNKVGEGTYKLYYYDNTKLFKCFTECDDTFDIFELVIKTQRIKGKVNFNLYQAINFISQFFGLSYDYQIENNNELIDWQILQEYDKNDDITISKKPIQLKEFDNRILLNLPQPRILNWENEGISKSIIQYYNVKYNPISHGIVIPHYDIDGRLIGIRERTLIKHSEQFGKYRPSILHNMMYNHPLGLNDYNLNNSKENIKIIKKAIIFESEKSCMKYAGYFGIENDISIAVCGSNITNYQFALLQDLNVQEIIIGFDKQFQSIGDEEWEHWIKKLKNINEKFKSFCIISFLFDKNNLLGYKDSPIDCGKEKFNILFQNRIIL